MNMNQLKSNRIQGKVSDSLLHTRYLKIFGQIKKHNDVHPIVLSRLERTRAYLTNYNAPIRSLSSHLTNKSIQVDDLDDSSYQTALTNSYSYLSIYETLFILISFIFFIFIFIFYQFHSYPLHCLLNEKFWYPINLPTGFTCENTNIEILYVEINQIIYQIELQKNIESNNCLDFDLLSCLPIEYVFVPKGQIIYRNDRLSKYCNSTQMIHCYNSSLTIESLEYKWNFQNNDNYELLHCSCSTQINSKKKCFHFMINSRCDLHIPWFNYCLKYSTIESICQAYIYL